jgi:hypothetical protein
VTRADDPLIWRVVSLLRVKVASDLPQEEAAEFERLFVATQQERQELANQRRSLIPHSSERWLYNEHGQIDVEDARFRVVRILRHELRGDHVLLLVRYLTDGKCCI